MSERLAGVIIGTLNAPTQTAFVQNPIQMNNYNPMPCAPIEVQGETKINFTVSSNTAKLATALKLVNDAYDLFISGFINPDVLTETYRFNPDVEQIKTEIDEIEEMVTNALSDVIDPLRRYIARAVAVNLEYNKL